nr:P-loop NTPase [Clostridia bacterium]
MSECTHDCSSCGENCSSRQIQKEKQNDQSNIKKVIGVVSGKGGVGKSLITSLLAANVQKSGYNAAILDADITGPSIPKLFGIKEKAFSPDGKFLMPAVSKNGVEIMSVNLLLENDSDPVVWRGPIIAGTVKQFWTDVMWGDVDYMFVDMPPGTGDVALTVFQSLPLDGIVIVSSPQELVAMIVEKAVKMAEMMNIPILGIAENMSYFKCPTCGEKNYIFGKSNLKSVAEKYGIKNSVQIPIDPLIAEYADKGLIEDLNADYIKEFFNAIK